MMDPQRHSEIATRAYQIWEREGRPHGRDFDHWLKAEREMRPEAPRPAKAPPAMPAKAMGSRKPQKTQS